MGQIQPYYNVGYEVISLIFLLGILSYGISCFCGDYLDIKIGRHKLAVLSGLLKCICWALICWAPPFPVLVRYLTGITLMC